jgi:neutral ceramidase
MKPTLTSWFACFCLLISASVAQAEISAGIAVVDITPPAGGLTAGYAPVIPTDGIHDPITARVLVLQSGQTSVAIVVWDLCVFNSPWLHEHLAETGIDRLLLLNTHTHAGPSLDQPGFPSKENPLKSMIEPKVLEAIKEAKQHLFPAFFAAGEGSIQLGYNRLVRQPEGFALTYFDNPERIPFGPVDPTMSVLRITDAQGSVRAVLVNYACHAVVLGPANLKISADYPGAMRREVEAKLGGNAVCFFLQGAAGEINPLIMARGKERDQDFPLVETMGKLVAGEALAIIDRMKSIPGKADQMAIASKQMTVDNRWHPKDTTQTGVTTILLNSDIGILAMPGEPFQQFQVDWRRKSGLPHPFFFGYCCNSADPWAGYLPDLESAARGGYGASDGTNAEVGTGERLLNQGLIQLYTLQGRLKAAPQRNLNQ